MNSCALMTYEAPTDRIRENGASFLGSLRMNNVKIGTYASKQSAHESGQILSEYQISYRK